MSTLTFNPQILFQIHYSRLDWIGWDRSTKSLAFDNK
jgi:hypothetical protein